TCSYAIAASSYAWRLWGESSNDSTRVNPLPASQMSSSWRRTLRWLRANPPGRSDAARRSLMIQVKPRGSRPWAQRPLTRRPSRDVRSCHHAVQLDRACSTLDVVHAHNACTEPNGPDGGRERAIVAPFDRVVAHQRAQEPLARCPHHERHTKSR